MTTETRTEGEVRALLAEIEGSIKDAALSGDYDKVSKLGVERGKLLKEIDAIEFEANKEERTVWLGMIQDSLDSIMVDTHDHHLEVTCSGLDGDNRSAKVSVVFEGLNESVVEALDDLLDQTPKGVRGFTYSNGEAKLGTTPARKVSGASSNGTGGSKGWVVNGETVSLSEAFEALATEDEKAALAEIKENAQGLKSVGSKAYNHQVKVVSGHGATKA